MQEAGCSGLVHWDDPEGWDEAGGGRGVQNGEHCTPMADSCEYSVEDRLLRSFSCCGRIPCVPSTGAGDLRELLRVPLRRH